jgi:tellurium resistance protein TerD
MAINLKKGGRVDVLSSSNGLKNIGIGLGWDTNESDTGDDFDLDASVFMINKSGKLPSDEYFIFYNNLNSPDGSIEHQGDNRTGEGEGDDESLFVNIQKIDSRVEELVVVVTIDEAAARRQNFGQVSNAFIRIYNLDNNEEIATYDLDEDFSSEIAIEFGRLYKKNNEWKFKAVGVGYRSGLTGFIEKFN